MYATPQLCSEANKRLVVLGVLCKLTFLAAPVLWRATCKLQFFGFARLLRMGFEQLLRRNYRFLKFARWSMISCFE